MQQRHAQNIFFCPFNGSTRMCNLRFNCMERIILSELPCSVNSGELTKIGTLILRKDPRQSPERSVIL
jgi:hypothetical protein